MHLADSIRVNHLRGGKSVSEVKGLVVEKEYGNLGIFGLFSDTYPTAIVFQGLLGGEILAIKKYQDRSRALYFCLINHPACESCSKIEETKMYNTSGGCLRYDGYSQKMFHKEALELLTAPKESP